MTTTALMSKLGNGAHADQLLASCKSPPKDPERDLTVRILHECVVAHTGQAPEQYVKTRVEFGPEAVSSGLLGRVSGNALKVLIALAKYTRPLVGDDLDDAIQLGIATAADAGRLFTFVTDLGLAKALGIHRNTVARAVREWEGEGLLQFLEIPAGLTLRSANGRYTAQRLILIAPDAGRSHRQVEKHRVEKTDTKSVVDVDAEKDQLVDAALPLTVFASLTNQPNYRTTSRDHDALTTLYQDGCSQQQIYHGIVRAVANAKKSATTPRRFAYCVPAVREVHPEQRRDNTDLSDHCRLLPLPAVENTPLCLAAAPEADAVNLQDSSPESVLENYQAHLEKWGKKRSLDLDKGTLQDLARLAIDYHTPAVRHGQTGLAWVLDALRTVDSQVERPARYVRSILRQWESSGHKPLSKRMNGRSDASTRRQRKSRSNHPISTPATQANGESNQPNMSCGLPWHSEADQSPRGDLLQPTPPWVNRFWNDLRAQMSDATFETLLADAQVVLHQGGHLSIEVASEQACAWLDLGLRPVVERAVEIAKGQATEFVFQVANQATGGE